MFSCRKTMERVSRGLDGELGPFQRMLVRGHTIMCSRCAAVRRQLKALDELVRRRFSRAEDGGDAGVNGLGQERQERLAARLRESINENQ